MQKPYVTVVVTLTLASPTRYNLLDLAVAIEPGLTAGAGQVDIKSPLTNADLIYIGDDQVSTTRFGQDMTPNSSYTIPPRGSVNSAPFGHVHAVSAAAGAKLALTIYT